MPWYYWQNGNGDGDDDNIVNVVDLNCMKRGVHKQDIIGFFHFCFIVFILYGEIKVSNFLADFMNVEVDNEISHKSTTTVSVILFNLFPFN